MTHGSLSTGIGGFDIGAENNGIKTIWTCEIDPLRRDLLNHHLPNAKHYSDIRQLEQPEYADVISFGFPCQDISRANPKGKGLKGKNSSLWYDGWRVIRKVRPRFIILENSPDLIHKGLRNILGQFAASGYNAEWHVISCQRFGLPHIRKRLFVVAYSKKIGVDTKQIFERSASTKHQQKAREAKRQIPVWSGSGRVHDTSFWTESISEFHHLDNGLPFNIYNGLVAAAGDTVSPLITTWIFGRIKQIEQQ